MSFVYFCKLKRFANILTSFFKAPFKTAPNFFFKFINNKPHIDKLSILVMSTTFQFRYFLMSTYEIFVACKSS